MDSRSCRAFIALSASVLLVLAALVVSGIVPFSAPGNSVGLGPISSSATGNFDQLVVVLMENHNLNEIYGPAPYMTQLADQYAFSEGWSSITNPSQPNYIAILGASTFGVSGDGNHPNLNHPTLVDLIENSGHTWNAIAEGSGSGCSINPDRGEDHFPFLSYTTITGSPARCANLHSGGSTDVVAALNAGTNFVWFTPTDQHNMHDNSVSSGDAWLQSWVPGLLTAMGSKKAALIIMFDEAYTSPPYIYMSFSGPATKLAYNSTASYTHYSLLKLIEDVWGGGNLGQGDVTAPSPLEFFNAGGPDFTLSASPNTVSFVPGQSASSAISLQSTGSFNGAVSLTAASTPAGLTTSCVPVSISGTQTSTCTTSGSTPGSYTVIVTGTNGTLSHTASLAVTVMAPGPPTARFTFAPSYPKVNNSVAFDASSSTDPDPSATLQARWDWEGDGVWDTSWSSTLTSQHVFTTAGAYLVELEIVDSHGLTAGIGQWVAVQNPERGDKTPPQVAILSPPNATVIETANVTVTGVAWDNVAISAIELSTDNATWTPTSGTTSWSGSVLLEAGTNHIYARAIDTSGNVRTAVITVIADNPNQGVPPAPLADPTVPILIGMSPVVALAAIHAFLWNRTRTPPKKVKKRTAVVGRPEQRDRWLLAANGIFKR